MTCAPDCPLCANAACDACAASEVLQVCEHDTLERHHALPVISRTTSSRPTEKIDRIADPDELIEISFAANARDGAASFLERAAKMIRTTGRLTIALK